MGQIIIFYGSTNNGNDTTIISLFDDSIQL